MSKVAFLISDGQEGSSQKIARILDLFRMPWRQLSPSALLDGVTDAESYVVLCPMPLLGRVLSEWTPGPGMPPLLEQADSVFLYGAEFGTATREVFGRLGLDFAALILLRGQQIPCTISGHSLGLCGPMAGLKMDIPLQHPQEVIVPCSVMDPLISTKEGFVFGAVTFKGKRWYLSTGDIVDVCQPLNKGYFDVADYFFSAVPVVMYLRYVFKDSSLGPAEQGACLIVDDPVLRPVYGFVNFQELTRLALEHDFSYNVAFIPWNWRRSQSPVVDLFRRYPDRLSISIHGCDHTSLEFAADSMWLMNRQAKLAYGRMNKHAKRTGLAYDPLMIFPQGAFSTTALRVLKHNGFIGAVNTELVPTDCSKGTLIADTWQMAILRYADFPIFTRRYAFHGMHNFAFDLLLGKPCLIVTHHSDFRNNCMDVVGFIDQLNALQVNLKWHSLGDVIRHSYQVQSDKGVLQIGMFGNEIFLTNGDPVFRRAVVTKDEHDADAIDRILANGQHVAFTVGDGIIRFEVELAPRSKTYVRVTYKDLYTHTLDYQSVGVQSRIAARRYLSEFRDESQARIPVAYEYAGRVKNWFSRARRRSNSN